MLTIRIRLAAGLALAVLFGCSGGGGSGPGGNAAFSLAADTAGQQVAVGGTMRFTLHVTATSALEEDVTLVVTDAPSGLTATLSQGSVRDGDVDLDVTAAPSLQPGTYDVWITGTYRDSTVRLRVSITVVDEGFDFVVDASERSLVLVRDGQATTPVQVTATRGTLPEVTRSVEGLPAGVSGSHDAANGLVLDATDAAATGTHEISLVATAGALRRIETVLVHVLPVAEASGLTIEVPAVLQVRRGGSTTAQVDIARDAGLTGNVGLAVSGLQNGVTAGFSANPAGGATSLLMLDAGPNATLGEKVVTVTATLGGSRGTAHCLLEVLGDEPVADVRIQRVELAQAFLAQDPGLVGGRDALVRAHVVADVPGTAAPAVAVEGIRAGTSLGSLPLSGPATLPTGEEPSTLGMSYTAMLPASWIAPGLELLVTLTPGAAGDREMRNDRIRITPNVGPENRIDLVLVPLQLGGQEAQPMDFTDLLLAEWPLTDVHITVRAPYTVTSTDSVSSDGTGWSTVLGEIASLRSSDGSSAYYYGIVPVSYGSGVAGIGYVGFPVSIGWNRSKSVLIHEIGHNFGLQHAPCGGAANPDSAYPFAGGSIGTWGYDSRSGSLLDPSGRRDLMSYCNPIWVSGYNYTKVRERLGAASAVVGLGVESPMLLVRGQRDAAGVRLLGVRHTVGRVEAPASGDLVLRLTPRGGAQIEYPLATLAIGCDAGVEHFQAAVPDPGPLARLEIVQGPRVLLTRTSTRTLAGGVAASRIGDAVSLTEREGALDVRWDPAEWSQVSIVHVGAHRTTLAVGLRGGAARVSLEGVPSGGRFEVDVADGIDGFAFDVAR